jgi:hypothetical protein
LPANAKPIVILAQFWAISSKQNGINNFSKLYFFQHYTLRHLVLVNFIGWGKIPKPVENQ